MVSRAGLASFVVAAAGLFWLACVGEDPSTPSTPDAGGPDTATTSSSSGSPSSDASSDGDAAEPECDLTKEFGAKVPVSGVLQGGATARLSADELVIYYTDFGGVISTNGSAEIVVGTRKTRNDAFGDFHGAGAINTSDVEQQPALTVDGTTIFFYRGGIFTATLADGGLFGAAASPLAGDVNQPGAFNATPFPDATGARLYFASDRIDAGFGHPTSIYVAERGDAGDYTNVKRLAELDTAVSPNASVGGPVLSQDGKTLYYGGSRTDLGGDGSTDIYVATRPDTSQVFGSIRRVKELATSGDEAPDWISPDGCRLYLTYRVMGGSGPTAIYVATRPK